MRICFYGYGIQDIGCGSSEYFTNIANALAESADNNITIATSSNRRNNLHPSVRHVSLNKNNSFFQKYFFFVISTIVFFIKNRSNFDIVHIGSSYKRLNYILAIVLPFVNSVKVFTSFTNISLPYFVRWIYDKVIFALEDNGNREYDSIPVGIDVKRFKSGKAIEYIAKTSHNYEFIIGTMGSPLPRRGHIVFLEMAKLLLEVRNDILFILAADLPQSSHEGMMRELNRYRKYIIDNNMQNNVKIIGMVEVPDFLASIDVFVYPLQTAYGAFDIPPTIIEVLASGVPMVCSDVGSIGSVIKENYNGFLVGANHIDDPRYYFNLVCRLISDKNLMSLISENSSESVSHFDIELISRRVYEKYLTLIDSRAGQE